MLILFHNSKPLVPEKQRNTLHGTKMFWNKPAVSKAVLHPSAMSRWFSILTWARLTCQQVPEPKAQSWLTHINSKINVNYS